MEIIREPRVTLIARPQFLEPAHLPVQWKGDVHRRRADRRVRRTALLHEPAQPGRPDHRGVPRNILKQGHGSVFEHSTYVMLIEGISRSCSHELVRHRAGFGLLPALPALRRRVPRRLRHAAGDPSATPRSRRRGPEQVETAQAAYVAAVERLMAKYEWVEDKVHRRKMAREAARSVLPNATEVKIVVERQRPRLADDARAPARRGRRARDPPDGGRLPARAAAGSAGPLRRLRDLSGARRRGGGTRRLPQGLSVGTRVERSGQSGTPLLTAKTRPPTCRPKTIVHPKLFLTLGSSKRQLVWLVSRGRPFL